MSVFYQIPTIKSRFDATKLIFSADVQRNYQQKKCTLKCKIRILTFSTTIKKRGLLLVSGSQEIFFQ